MSKLQWTRVIGVIGVYPVDILQRETYICQPCECITLFNHVIQFQDLGVCQAYFVGPHIKHEHLFIIHTYRLTLENLGGVLPVLFIRIFGHPGNIKREHCSSCYYSLKILFIATLSLKLPTLFTIFLLSCRHSSLFVSA